MGGDNYASKQTYENLSQFSAATLHEAAKQNGFLPPEIKPLTKGFKVAGPAFPVMCSPGDNLQIHKAVYEAEAGDVLVVYVGNEYHAGYWGDILSNAALQRKLGGLVINGAVRDSSSLIELGFPVFSRGVSIKGTSKDKKKFGSIGDSIKMGEAEISKGDLIVGDSDGVVVISKERTKSVLEEAKQRENKEEEIKRQLRKGRTTLELYNF